MNKYLLTIIGLTLTTIGIVTFMILKSQNIGMILMIIGFLLCLGNLIFIIRKTNKT